MKIEKIETFHCDAGWRPWTFIKIQTDDGLVGWSECTDSHGSPSGIEAVVKTLDTHLIGENPISYEKIYWKLYAATRQSTGSIVQKAIGGIENALLDIMGKFHGVPVYELFGGAIRNGVDLYWSHCGTTRARAWEVTNTPKLDSIDKVYDLVKEVKDKGFKALKTNIVIPGETPYVHMPGFGKGIGSPELNITHDMLKRLESYIGAIREAGGEDLEIILDLNYNFKTEGYIKIAKAMEKFNLFWLEIDSFDPKALRHIRNQTYIPICSGENLFTTRDYKPFFDHYSMDIASIDVLWNGFAQSKKISDLAELHEMNVTPHNYYSHIASIISAHFCAVIPNFRIMEIDIDDVPWKDDLVNKQPIIDNGRLILPKDPGWGIEINEEVFCAHPWPKR